LPFQWQMYFTQFDCAQYKLLQSPQFNCMQLKSGAYAPNRDTALAEEEVVMARKHSTDLPLRLDNQLCFAVYSTAHAFNRVYKPLLDSLGLTYPQYLVMLVLWERDGVPVKDIGERLFLDSGTLTPLLKRLEAAELIKRTRSTEDERQVLIALTAKGEALREKARTVPQSILAASACSVGELMAMKNEIVALRDRLNAVLGE
jgi:MarR family transcriptional regulator, organic hydroperoxide resistance regulator